MLPDVSVVCPVYNQSHLIPNAINSIINQTFQNWEMIIINDGSHDNIHEVVSRFKDERIRLIDIDHGGLVAARNAGNKEAKAEVIIIQDADDLSLPDRLEKCLWHIKDVDIVYHGGYTNMWDTQYNCIGRKYLPAPLFNKQRLLKGQYIPGWPMFRKKVWKERPFRYETQFMYDWMMYLDWAFSGYKFKALNLGLYEYVRHENSASISFERDGRRKESKEAIKKIMLEKYGETIN